MVRLAQVLLDVFPYKSQEDVRSIKRTLAREHPNAEIYYRQIFAEDVEGAQTKTLEMLRDQYINELQQAYPRLEAAIRRVKLEEAVKNQRISEIPEGQVYIFVQALRELELFQALSEDILNELIGRIRIVTYSDGDAIVSEGTSVEDDGMYILREGAAEVTRGGVSGVLKTYGIGDFFGELALLNDDVRAATVMARASPGFPCQCLWIKKKDFMELVKSDANEGLFYAKQMEYFAVNKVALSQQDNSGKNKTLSSEFITVDQFKTAIYEHFDPAYPRSEVKKLILIALGFDVAKAGDEEPADLVTPTQETPPDQVAEVEAPLFTGDAKINVEQAMMRWRKHIILRYSRPNNEMCRSRSQRTGGYSREVSERERQTIEKVFEEFDVDGTGSLDLEEVGAIFHSVYGINPSKRQLQKLMAQMDTDGDGGVDLEEFVEAMSTVEVCVSRPW